jgi:hypothetical protein
VKKKKRGHRFSKKQNKKRRESVSRHIFRGGVGCKKIKEKGPALDRLSLQKNVDLLWAVGLAGRLCAGSKTEEKIKAYCNTHLPTKKFLADAAGCMARGE